jgi:predicted TIM-barrel fold metal-dependent hydrolase
MYADELLAPWFAPLRAAVPDLDLFDCHTHVGVNDPSGFSVTTDELLESLEIADGRAAVFPLKEPGGYAEPNLRAVALAHEHTERLVAFCRLDPADRPLERATDALGAGARGIKLHPAGDEFDIADPRLDGVYRLADEQQLPIIVHAGPEIDGLGETALDLCRRFAGARLILAHDALTDLSWIFEHVEAHPNLFFDTSWWGPVHTMALFALVPPGRVLTASDLPYCSPLSGAITTLRCGIQAGLDEAQLRLAMGGQFRRLLDREDPIDAGPPPGLRPEPLDPLLERVFVTLLTGLEALQRDEDLGNALPVTRHACKVSDHHRYAHVFRSVTRLLDLYEAHQEELVTDNPYAAGWDLIAAAALIARTPDAPLPEDA